MWSWSEPWLLFAPIMLIVCVVLLYVMTEPKAKYDKYDRKK